MEVTATKEEARKFIEDNPNQEAYVNENYVPMLVCGEYSFT